MKLAFRRVRFNFRESISPGTETHPFSPGVRSRKKTIVYCASWITTILLLPGGGAGGLSLAYHLARSPLGERSILIIDKDAKNQNDHTWCFWIEGPLLFDEIAYRTWNQIEFAGDDFNKIIDLETYQYRMIRGVDFYRFTRAALQTRPNVEFLQGNVERELKMQKERRGW